VPPVVSGTRARSGLAAAPILLQSFAPFALLRFRFASAVLL